MSASSTSAPPVIIENAFSMAVCAPPFLNWFPLLDAMTTGLTLLGVMTVGACPKSVFGMAAAATPAAVVARTKSRRFSFFMASIRRPSVEERVGLERLRTVLGADGIARLVHRDAGVLAFRVQAIEAQPEVR